MSDPTKDLEALRSCLSEVEDLQTILHSNDYWWTKYSKEVSERVRLQEALQTIANHELGGPEEHLVLFARKTLSKL